MANLIDRLESPLKCLERLPGLVRPGGQLILASPYTWLASYTPRKKWLGGFTRGGRPVKTFDALRRILKPHFKLIRRLDLPFLLREHTRKYQLGISEASRLAAAISLEAARCLPQSSRACWLPS
jgi:ribosome modulation factor